MENLVVGEIVELKGYHIVDRVIARVVEVNPSDKVWVSDHQGGGWWAHGQYILTPLVNEKSMYSSCSFTLAFDDLSDHHCGIYEDCPETFYLAQKYLDEAIEDLENDLRQLNESKYNYDV